MVKELELKLKREHSQCLKFTKVIFDFDLLSELEKWTYQNVGRRAFARRYKVS